MNSRNKVPAAMAGIAAAAAAAGAAAYMMNHTTCAERRRAVRRASARMSTMVNRMVDGINSTLLG